MSTPVTLAQAIHSETVPFSTLEKRYRPMLLQVRELLGVVPNCDTVLEVWPTGFRTYNLIVPNFLNLPKFLLGMGASKSLVGLAMYRSSRAAECAYCSAHTCSFALRRGTPERTITGSYDATEAAVVGVAEGLSTMPASLSTKQRQAFAEHVSPRDQPWVIMGVAMMGFLNKFMDAMGIELEAESISDVAELISPDGWRVGQHLWHENSDASVKVPGDSTVSVDNVSTYLRIARQAPAAIKLERRWTKTIPSDALQARQYLKRIVGVDFPMIAQLPNAACVRAVTTVLRDNLDMRNSMIGIANKGLIGLVFAIHARNKILKNICHQLAKGEPERYSDDFIDSFATPGFQYQLESDLYIEIDGLDEKSHLLVSLAMGMSSSPARVTADQVSETTERLTAAEIVEVAVWISILQMLHRIDTFYSQD